ncbi:MAG: Mpo1-like protein [Myxococcota bacterium]
MTDEPIRSFEEFWPYYVGEHRNPINRGLHYLGTSMALGAVATAAVTRNPKWLLAAPVLGYGPAWVGHFFLEQNKPATFDYPLWSLMADFKMLGLAVRGRMADEVTRLYGSPNPPADAPLVSERPRASATAV